MKKLLPTLFAVYFSVIPFVSFAQDLSDMTNNSGKSQQIKQEIIDFLKTNDDYSFIDDNDKDLIRFKDNNDGITYGVEFAERFDHPEQLYTRFYVFTTCDKKIHPAVYKAVQEKLQEYKTIKCVYSNKDGYFVICQEMYLANADNFISTFYPSKEFISTLFNITMPALISKYQDALEYSAHLQSQKK